MADHEIACMVDYLPQPVARVRVAVPAIITIIMTDCKPGHSTAENNSITMSVMLSPSRRTALPVEM
jgi:hypothetical protein